METEANFPSIIIDFLCCCQVQQNVQKLPFMTFNISRPIFYFELLPTRWIVPLSVLMNESSLSPFHFDHEIFCSSFRHPSRQRREDEAGKGDTWHHRRKHESDGLIERLTMPLHSPLMTCLCCVPSSCVISLDSRLSKTLKHRLRAPLSVCFDGTVISGFGMKRNTNNQSTFINILKPITRTNKTLFIHSWPLWLSLDEVAD